MKKIYIKKKKVADAAQRSFSENQIVVDGGKKNMNEGLLMKLGVTVSCFVMHFSFDQYYYQCKKKKEKNLRDLLNCSHESGIPRPR